MYFIFSQLSPVELTISPQSFVYESSCYNEHGSLSRVDFTM